MTFYLFKILVIGVFWWKHILHITGFDLFWSFVFLTIAKSFSTHALFWETCVNLVYNLGFRINLHGTRLENESIGHSSLTF